MLLQFSFGGCRGNANNFLTEADCISKCVGAAAMPRALAGFNEEVRSPCEQEKVVGLCRAKMPAYFYDKV